MTRQHPQASSLDIDFYSDETLKDPAGTYRKMRDAGPVVWLCRHQIHAICSHEALTRSLRNHRVFQSGQGVSINEDVNKILVGSTLNSDGGRNGHIRRRSRSGPPFAPQSGPQAGGLGRRREQNARLGGRHFRADGRP